MSEPQPLEALLAKSAAGDDAAFQELYRETSPKLLGLAIHILQDRDAAEDVLQIAFLKVWNNAKSYDPEKSMPMTWLASILRNTAIDELRKQKRWTFVSDEILENIRSDEVSVLDRIEQQEVSQAAIHALQQVSPDKQAITRLAYLEDVSRAELARRFDTSEGTIKTKLRRTLLTLREILEQSSLGENAT